MANARKRKWLHAALIVGTGMAFQPSGCANYAVSQALSAFDFCAVFNCEGGTFFDMCHPRVLLTDCPTATQTAGQP